LSETEKLLNDIRAYLRISAASASRAVAKIKLDTYEKALVYSRLDGKTSQAKIGADAQVHQTTVGDWIAEFVQAGLASPPDRYNDTHKALFTLQELGIELAGLKKRAKTAKQSQPSATTSSQSPTPPPAEPSQDSVQKTLGA
jgi:hypothetical protein